MKIITIIFLWNIISINWIHAQKCYVCDDETGCDYPASGNIKQCADDGTAGNSGKSFVNGALDKNNAQGIYKTIQDDLKNFVTSSSINLSAIPDWNSLTQWVCYVTKDKHRGCLLMGKGLCSGSKSWLGEITNLADKINSIMDKAKSAVTKMFTNSTNNDLTDIQKSNISNWFAENYMTKLVNNSNKPQFQLGSCCEGDACNSAPMIQKSITMFSLLFLSTLILI